MRLPRTLRAGKSWNDQAAAICFIILKVGTNGRGKEKENTFFTC